MRHLRRFCAVFTLLCAFSFSAYAGDIPCPAVISEPPPEGGASSTQSSSEADSTVTEALLILLESVLLVS